MLVIIVVIQPNNQIDRIRIIMSKTSYFRNVLKMQQKYALNNWQILKNIYLKFYITWGIYISIYTISHTYFNQTTRYLKKDV